MKIELKEKIWNKGAIELNEKLGAGTAQLWKELSLEHMLCASIAMDALEEYYQEKEKRE